MILTQDSYLNGARWANLTHEETARVMFLRESGKARLRSRNGWLIVELIP